MKRFKVGQRVRFVKAANTFISLSGEPDGMVGAIMTDKKGDAFGVHYDQYPDIDWLWTNTAALKRVYKKTDKKESK